MAPNLIKSTSQDIIRPIDDHHQQPSITLDESSLLVNGHLILSEVPPKISLTQSSLSEEKLTNMSGSFLGFTSDTPESRHVVHLGKLKNIRFMSIFRFKVWWTTHWVGNKGSDVENETQMMILDQSDSGRPYVLLLPLIEGSFRGSLQSGHDDHIDLCMESGSTQVNESEFKSSLYIHIGDDPFSLIKEAMRLIRVHLGTFKLLEEKSPPEIVDKFGWCTWDSFYLKVNPEGIWGGVKGLAEGGCPPGFLLIDDGWQSICADDEPLTEEGTERTSAGEQMPCRLVKYEENYKFSEYESKEQEEDEGVPLKKGMGAFIKDLKHNFGSLDYVYVWHALCGYWGGIRPDVPGLPESKMVCPKLSEGLKMTMEDLAVDKIVKNGIGLVRPEMAQEMYEGIHSHLESVGIDGVKVDVIHLLEMLSEEYGGRVDLAKAYYKALSASVKKHFNGNGVIASMEHCNDFMFLGTEAISLGRVGDDFWGTDPSGDPNGTFWLQGCHMVHCAYNSIWMGNFIHPDWDMFQSTHPCAKFHAASRAVSGGPIYISDFVGKHDFQLLKSLALPDGTILRCEYYALPTRDCLFEYPLHDGTTMLKIWNLNKYTGVLGAFNCQGGGWCPEERRNKSFSGCSHALTSTMNMTNIEWKSGKTPISLDGIEAFAVYMSESKKLVILKPTENIDISLEPFTFELLTVSPLKMLQKKMILFAPIGLVNMLNTGGAIKSLIFDEDENLVRIGVKGTGEMRVFASEKPKACRLDGNEVSFTYDEHMVVIQVPWPNSSRLTIIEYLF